MYAPCYNCHNRRKVTMAKDGYMYCAVCHPDTKDDFLYKLFGLRK